MYGNPIEDEEDYENTAYGETGAVWTGPKSYEVHDSGVKAEYDDGMRRDTNDGKPRFDLIWPEGIPYEEQLLTRVAMQYERGGKKYGDRNWERSSTPKSLAHHTAALLRHVFKFIGGVEDGEDHAAAIVWNVNAVLVTRRNIKKKAQEPWVHSFTTYDRPEVPFRRYNPSEGKYEDE